MKSTLIFAFALLLCVCLPGQPETTGVPATPGSSIDVIHADGTAVQDTVESRQIMDLSIFRPWRVDFLNASPNLRFSQQTAPALTSRFSKTWFRLPVLDWAPFRARPAFRFLPERRYWGQKWRLP